MVGHLKFYIFCEKFLYKFSKFYNNQLKQPCKYIMRQVHNACAFKKTKKMNNNHEEYIFKIYMLIIIRQCKSTFKLNAFIMTRK